MCNYGSTLASDLQQNLQQKRNFGAWSALCCISASFVSHHMTSIDYLLTILCKQHARIKSPLLTS